MGGAESYVSIRLQGDAEAVSPELCLESEVLEPWVLRLHGHACKHHTSGTTIAHNTGPLSLSLRARPSPGCLSGSPRPKPGGEVAETSRVPSPLHASPSPDPITRQAAAGRHWQGVRARRQAGAAFLPTSTPDLAPEMARLSLWLVTLWVPAAMPEFPASEMRQPGGVVASKGTSSHTSLSAELGSDGSHIHTRT